MAAIEPTKPTEAIPPVRWLSDEEAREEFDRQATFWLGISGEEFLRRWDAGEYPGFEDPDNERLVMVTSLMSFVRP